MSSGIERRAEPINNISRPQKLTSRQTQIAMLISEGLSNKEVGRRLKLAEGTIKLHLHNIYTKLGLRNRTALSVFVIQSAHDLPCSPSQEPGTTPPARTERPRHRLAAVHDSIGCAKRDDEALSPALLRPEKSLRERHRQV